MCQRKRVERSGGTVVLVNVAISTKVLGILAAAGVLRAAGFIVFQSVTVCVSAKVAIS